MNEKTTFYEIGQALVSKEVSEKKFAKLATMRFFIQLISVLVFAGLGLLAVMLAARHGLAPCPTCRDLITPYQGGFIYFQLAGVVVGGGIGGGVAWLLNRSRPKR
jgi:hypothetical protein